MTLYYHGSAGSSLTTQLGPPEWLTQTHLVSYTARNGIAKWRQMESLPSDIRGVTSCMWIHASAKNEGRYPCSSHDPSSMHCSQVTITNMVGKEYCVSTDDLPTVACWSRLEQYHSSKCHPTLQGTWVKDIWRQTLPSFSCNPLLLAPW